ncbi:hypothetical protein MMC18_000461 [Xylographa bjoerkii]|nr:hypothetical protein [Xylographa bjoerkii]
METNNTLKHPSGPEYQLAVGEGTYVLRDDFHLATPPPHPSEAPPPNLNPLATTPAPPTSGIKLSIVVISPRKVTPHLYSVNTRTSERSNLATYSIKESEKESRESHETSGDEAQFPPYLNGTSGKAPAFGAENTLLAPITGKDALKRKKPKNNIIKSNSSYVSRVIPHEAMAKRLQERNPEGLFAFANINRAFQWLDITTNNMFKAEHLTKILFTKAHVLCHDVNDLTKSTSHLDVIMGTSTADIICSKKGMINASPISSIRWIPGSENLFLASHTDGTLLVYDKEREDAAFSPEENGTSTPERNGDAGEVRHIHINKSVNSKNQKSNPVASWKISNQRINAFAFSPDSRHLAVVSEDGSLRVIDYLKEVLVDLYTSYYGGLMCVCWSPDGKYVLTGGQDDLVTIWSLAERQIVARCPGHHSWVTAVAFDPWRCDERNYRFGSVGEDCRLLLWDFNVGMLHRPKAASVRQRGSMSSHLPLTRNRTESQATARIRSNSSLTTNSAEGEETIEHAVESRTRTAELPPVMSKLVDPDPLCWIGFEEDCIITSCDEGHIRTWDRPREGVDNSQATLSAAGSST